MKLFNGSVFAIICLLFLSACAPQWSRPIFESKATSQPPYMDGVWEAVGNADNIIQFRKLNGSNVAIIATEEYVATVPVIYTTIDGIVFVSFDLKNIETLGKSIEGVVGSRPRRGYWIFAIDVIDNNDIALRNLIDIQSKMTTDGLRSTRLCRTGRLDGEMSLIDVLNMMCIFIDTRTIETRGAEDIRRGIGPSAFSLHRIGS